LALVILAATALAFAIVDRRDPALPLETACYGKASLDAPRRFVETRGDSAAACAVLWRAGVFGSDQPAEGFDTCVLASGVPAVFPGESGDVCARLGLPAAKPATSTERYVRVTEAVNDAVSGHCAAEAEARSIINHTLTTLGEDPSNWPVTRDDRPFSADEPCASLIFVRQPQGIRITPIADPRAPVGPPAS
jgi:hypothetical protein